MDCFPLHLLPLQIYSPLMKRKDYKAREARVWDPLSKSSQGQGEVAGPGMGWEDKRALGWGEWLPVALPKWVKGRAAFSSQSC